ncbi:MAG: hypothetical protein ACREME_12480 [Gemmatimonadales bacterium]
MKSLWTLIATAALTLPLAAPAAAQTPSHPARPADVASPEAIVRALYEAVTRRPGEPFQWDRMRSLFLPNAILIPNTEQTGGAFRPLTVEEFIAWVKEDTTIGGPQDKGFQEEEIAHRMECYGDIALVFSTYQKHFWNDAVILGRGINAIQLVRWDDRWWVVSIVWDEENGAGPIPEAYRVSRSCGS